MLKQLKLTSVKFHLKDSLWYGKIRHGLLILTKTNGSIISHIFSLLVLISLISCCKSEYVTFKVFFESLPSVPQQDTNYTYFKPSVQVNWWPEQVMCKSIQVRSIQEHVSWIQSKSEYVLFNSLPYISREDTKNV